MGDEGHFRMSDGTAIDIDLEKSRLLDVVNHEFVHSELYTTTSYGLFTMMLAKNGIVDPKSQILKDVLFSYMGRMQERTAVNIELMLRCAEKGLTDYFNAIDDLKNRSNVYYNHFRKLCCINGKINKEQDAKQDAEQYVKVLKEIARIALNVDLGKIPFLSFKTKKDIECFFTNPNNSVRYLPNKRFDILVNILFRNNQNNNDYDAVYLGSLNIDRMDDTDYIHENAMKALQKMYKDNPLQDRLLKRADSVGSKGIIGFDGVELLAVRPTSINADGRNYIQYVESKDKFIKILEEQEKKYVYISNRLRGFEELQTFCIFEEKDNKRIIYSWHVWEEDNKTLYDLLNTLDCHFVFFKTKFMNKERNVVRKMVKELPIYIFEDTPILNSLDVIGKMYFGGKYGYIRRQKDSIVVFIKRSVILFVNIISEAEKVLYEKLKEYSIVYTSIEQLIDVRELLYLDKMCNDYEGNSINDFKIIK